MGLFYHFLRRGAIARHKIEPFPPAGARPFGRALFSAAENTGVPGNIGGYTVERIIRAVKDGIFSPVCSIGDVVEAGQTVGYVDGEPVKCLIGGVLRGILPENTPVYKGMKSGDVDPRCELAHCFTVSDKALAVGGGVLEAVLRLSKGEKDNGKQR